MLTTFNFRSSALVIALVGSLVACSYDAGNEPEGTGHSTASVKKANGGDDPPPCVVTDGGVHDASASDGGSYEGDASVDAGPWGGEDGGWGGEDDGADGGVGW